MKSIVRAALFASCTLATAIACGGDAGGWAGTARDSAGVTIMQNTEQGIWSEADQPTLQEVVKIGTAAGDSLYQFASVAAIDVASDGSIYVLDQQARRIRVYDAAGKYLRSFGRAGSGPGELGPATTALFISSGDTLVVADMSSQRVNFYAIDGTSLGSTPMQMSDGLPLKWVERDDGLLVVQLRAIDAGSAAADAGPLDRIVVKNARGETVDTMLTMPMGETFTLNSRAGQFRMRLFSPEPMWTIGSDGSAYFGMNSEYSINSYDSTGTLVRVVRRNVQQVPVTEEAKTSILDLMKQAWRQAGVAEAMFEQILPNIGFADYFPAIGNVMGGPGGTLWVQRARTLEEMQALGADFDPQNAGSPKWDVFDSEGHMLGTIVMPDGFVPQRFIDSRVAGVWRDENDVQYVTILRVVGLDRRAGQ